MCLCVYKLINAKYDKITTKYFAEPIILLIFAEVFVSRLVTVAVYRNIHGDLKDGSYSDDKLPLSFPNFFRRL